MTAVLPRVATSFSFFLLCPPQPDSGRQTRIGFQKFLHETKRGVIFLLCIRYRAIRGHEQIKVAHIGIVRCKKDAKVPSNTGEN